MVFANILVEGWIVYPNVYSFFNQPDIVVLLSPHYGEIINSGIMTCDGTVVMYGGFQMLFKPFTKGTTIDITIDQRCWRTNIATKWKYLWWLLNT